MTNETFIKKYIEAFKKSKTQTWIAQELNITTSAVTARKKKLAEAGVDLPVLVRAKNVDIDASDLNDLIASELNG